MRILFIEDSPGHVRSLRKYLTEAGAGRFEVTHERRISTGLDRLSEQNFDAVLLDLALPDSQGVDPVVRLRDVAKKIPLVVLTEVEDEALAVRLTQAGVQDYLVEGQVTGPLLMRSLRDAAERARMEEAVRESERRLQQLTDNTPAMVWITEPDASCTFLSKSWCEFTGQTPETGLGFGWLDVVHPDDRTATHGIFLAANAKQEAFRLDYRLRRADGEYRWCIDAGRPRFDDHGTFLGYIGFVMDITERKKLEQLEAGQRHVLELIAKDAALPTVFEALIRMIEEQSVTRMVASILLVDADGVHLRSGAAPSLPEAYNRAIDGIAVGPSAGSCGTSAYRRRPVYVSDIATDPLWADFAALALPHNLRACWSTPILSSTGRLLGTFAMYYPDVREPNEQDLRLVAMATRTAAIAIERSQAEQALRESEARYRGIVDQSIGGIAETDLTGRFTTVNDRYCEITGYSRDDLVGRMRLQDMMHPDDLPHGLLRQVTTQGTAFEIERRYIRKDGSLVWVHNSVSVIRNAAGQAQSLVAVSIDISKRKWAEEERNKQELLISLMLSTGLGCIKRVAADGTLL